MSKQAALPASEFSDEDRFRAQWYRLLARLLSAPPDDSVLQLVAGLDGDESALGQAVDALAQAAGATSPAAAAREYNALFIGIGRGELVPFGSYYLTGFLNEKPLAKLRQDMARLAIARAAGVKEPEDHIAALCEMMAGLVAGEFGGPASLAEQRNFFATHVEPWASRFFEDLEGAAAAHFYRPVAAVGRLLMAIEAEAFAMGPDDHGALRTA